MTCLKINTSNCFYLCAFYLDTVSINFRMNKDASIVKLVETYMRDATRAAKGPKDFRLISSTRENFYRMLAQKSYI